MSVPSGGSSEYEYFSDSQRGFEVPYPRGWHVDARPDELFYGFYSDAHRTAGFEAFYAASSPDDALRAFVEMKCLYMKGLVYVLRHRSPDGTVIVYTMTAASPIGTLEGRIRIFVREDHCQVLSFHAPKVNLDDAQSFFNWLLNSVRGPDMKKVPPVRLPSPGASLPPPAMQEFIAPDGSCRITAPSGWQFRAGECQAFVAGIINGRQAYVLRNSYFLIAENVFCSFGLLHASPYAPAEPFFRNIYPALVRKRMAGTEISHIVIHERQAVQNGEFYSCSLDISGKPFRGYFKVETLRLSGGQWMGHVEGLAAEEDFFSSAVALLKQIYYSFSYDQGYVQRRQAAASWRPPQSNIGAISDIMRRTNEEISASMEQSYANRCQSEDYIQELRTQSILGYDTVRDRATGQVYNVPLDFARDYNIQSNAPPLEALGRDEYGKEVPVWGMPVPHSQQYIPW